jgi:cysteine desulfurase
MKLFNKNKRIYLDYASATPMASSVLSAMEISLKEDFANSGSIHQDGVKSKNILEKARSNTAKFFDVKNSEIIFTGSATESDNLAILGVVRYWQKENSGKTAHVVINREEHSAVLESIKKLKTENVEVTYIKPDETGFINPKEVEESLKENTVLVSVMYVSNELGNVQKIKEIGKRIRHYKKYVLKNTNSKFPLLHTDASQALGLYETSLNKLPVDLLTCSSQKIYGPKGVGVLVKKENVKIEPIFFGGSQEGGLRPSTQNIPAIVGFEKALQDISKNVNSEKLLNLKEYGIKKLKETLKEVRINSGISTQDFSPHILSISVPDIESEVLVLELDGKHISVSSQSACIEAGESSETVQRLENGSHGVVRLSFGIYSKKSDINVFAAALKSIVKKYEDLRLDK